ncbi:MAG TPA: HNH endonuclease [Streptosporangiaceae bacterium]|nr:HNH endonuclease [Streptosporangiaceae bacterium]
MTIRRRFRRQMTMTPGSACTSRSSPVAARQDSPAALMAAYSGRCAVTGCTVQAVLEAAHLRPYRGPDSNVTGNGLLLRADIHTLLDLQLLA